MVTLKRKYILLDQNNCVAEMVKEQRARLEVASSSPNQREYTGTKGSFGTTLGVPVRTKGILRPVPKAVFLVVYPVHSEPTNGAHAAQV